MPCVVYLITHIKTDVSYHRDCFIFFMIIFSYSFHKHLLCSFSRAGDTMLGGKDTKLNKRVPSYQEQVGEQGRFLCK